MVKRWFLDLKGLLSPDTAQPALREREREREREIEREIKRDRERDRER